MTRNNTHQINHKTTFKLGENHCSIYNTTELYNKISIEKWEAMAHTCNPTLGKAEAGG
jgi:hypothetical protein